MTRYASMLAAAMLFGVPSGLCAQVDADRGPERFSLRTSVKASLLLSRAPDAPDLYPDRNAATSFWRVRFEPTVRAGHGLVFGASYEQRLRVFSQASGLSGAGILPADAPAPFRISQLDWGLSETKGSSWRHEVDRAYLAWHLAAADITVGRQAVGWGRGVMFGTIDVFSPFSPLEADREWRRGVDSVRVEVPIQDRTSMDVVAAIGKTVDESALAGRFRGYAGRIDVELVGGRRGRDAFVGATSSAVVGDAELHGEAAVFRANDATPDAGSPGATVKLVAGASRRFGIGPGLFVLAEYHYSGFGVTRPEDLAARLAEPTFLARLLRGDMQTLGRHALAVMTSTELSPTLGVGGQWLHNPADGSGVMAPSGTVSVGDNVSIVLNLYATYGRRPMGTLLRSEHGAGGLSGFVQLRIYT